MFTTRLVVATSNRCFSKKSFNNTMIKFLVLLMIVMVVKTSMVKPCKKLFNKVTCRGNLSRFLTPGYLTRQALYYNILEIINTDISHLESEWTDGRNNITWLKVNFNDNLHTLSSDTFNNLKELMKLDLKYNKISSLDNIVFYPLKKLEYLNLEHNNLQKLQTGLFTSQQQLKFLNLNNNLLKEINSVVLNMLLNLEELYLEENSLQFLDGRCFMSLENLRILNLSKNFLKKLPTTLFQYQKRLKQLNLNDNNFTEFDPAILAGLHHLQNFTFRNNNVLTLDFASFKSLERLQVLDLSESRLLCDCSAKIFNQHISERSIQLKLTCKPPKAQNYVNASEYLPQLDCSIVDKPKLELLIILGLLSVSVLVDILVSWINYRYDLSAHRSCSSELVNEYEYVDNFKDLEEKAYKSAGVRDSGRYQSVLQKVMSVYDYLRPLPGRRINDESSNAGSNLPIPLCTAPPKPETNHYNIAM